MKKKLFLSWICIFTTILSYSQIIYIPDVNFKNALLIAGTGQPSPAFALANWTYENPDGVNILIDANHDGEIQQSEALAVSFLAITNSSINNLTGIEYFTNLRGIFCAVNNISTVNLYTLTQLESLVAYNNQLSTLDLTGLSNLKNLNCWNNQITSLNFAGLPYLKRVYCGHNLLNSLDFSGNPLFEDLGCEYNPNLTTIKIKNNHTQLFGSQTLYNQCWGGNPSLNYICADAAEIPALQSFLAGCNITQAITIDSACALSVEGFAKNEVSVFPNPSTGVVYLDNTNSGFKTVQVFNSIGQLISTQTLGVAASASIDLSNYSKGVYLLNFQGEKGSKSCKVVKD